ncbi:phosphatidylserine decarboxylase [Brucella tritici]|uniref:Phosphatidylserine decarboxylase proenzyme n=1 Tax=Brucella tritici TaxID=94626 RepID=A0A6L3YN62_9HYPH|nr:phosphatidylserine decarboxylase [Brucella tritici]KAB2684362.1 phosphatidylserine decarboxylase [Brucella tritici]
MSLLSSLKCMFTPVHPAGFPFIGLGAFAAVGAAIFSPVLTWPLLIITGWTIYFFRNPIRITPIQDGVIVSPAEGRVSLITKVPPPPELGLPQVQMIRVSVFMSIFDCHVNRIPISGRIARIAYSPGKFLSADLDKASDSNERNAIAIDSAHGQVAVVQIAGLIARRIKHWVAEGDEMNTGDRFGLIRFGSRLDVYLPLDATILVSVGQTAIVGETILADLRSVPPGRLFQSK